MKKRLFSLFITFLMTVTLFAAFPAQPVIAADVIYTITKNGTNYDCSGGNLTGITGVTLEAAINAISGDAQPGNTKVIQFGNGTDALNLGFDIATIGFDCTITGNVTGDNNIIKIESDVNITTNANITSKDSTAIIAENGGDVTVIGGTVSTTVPGTTAISSGFGDGNIIVDGGTVTTKNGLTIASYSDGDVIIKSGTVSSTGTGPDGRTIGNYGTGDVEINGGTILAEGIDGRTIGNYNTGNVTINGGIISAPGSDGHAISSDNVLIINDGTISATGENGCAIGSIGTLTVNGGTISATGNNGRAIDSNGTLTVSGGTISATGTGANTRAISCVVGSSANITAKPGTGEYAKVGDTAADALFVNDFTLTDADTYKYISFGVPTALTFNRSSAFDVPSGAVDTAITPIDVSSGVSGGISPYTFDFVSVPSWLSISTEGVISGIRPATSAAAATATVRVSDADIPAHTATLIITVGEVTSSKSKLVDRKLVVLEAPTELAWDTDIPAKATWSEVEKSAGYTVQLYKNGAQYRSEITALDNEYDFTKIISVSGEDKYTFRVKACGDYFLYSDSKQSEESPVYDYIKPHNHIFVQHNRVEPTCTNEGNTGYLECTLCSQYYAGKESQNSISLDSTVIPRLPHDYSTDWRNDASSHWHECICGDKVDSEEHIPGEWIIDRLPTAKKPGLMHKQCVECGCVVEKGFIMSILFG